MFDVVSEALAGRLTATLDSPGNPIERFDRALDDLDPLASAPACARLFLVEVRADGPEALRRLGPPLRAHVRRLFEEVPA
jgi:hypothetical protein